MRRLIQHKKCSTASELRFGMGVGWLGRQERSEAKPPINFERFWHRLAGARSVMSAMGQMRTVRLSAVHPIPIRPLVSEQAQPIAAT